MDTWNKPKFLSENPLQVDRRTKIYFHDVLIVLYIDIQLSDVSKKYIPTQGSSQPYLLRYFHYSFSHDFRSIYSFLKRLSGFAIVRFYDCFDTQYAIQSNNNDYFFLHTLIYRYTIELSFELKIDISRFWVLY